MDEFEAVDCGLGSPDPGTSPLGRAHPRGGTLANQVALKLGDAAQDVKKKPARGRARVDALIEDHEVNAEGLKLAGEAGKVMDATREAIQLRAGENVEASAPSIG